MWLCWNAKKLSRSPACGMSWKLLAYIGSCLAGVLPLLLLWGVLIEPRLFQLKRETAVLPGLPQKREGKRIALIADTQVGMWFGK